MLPEKYKWLEEMGPLPKLVTAALQYLGIKEIPGSKSNPVILDMAKGLGLENIYTDDDISWCALFINHLIRITGKPTVDTEGDKGNLLRARWLLKWGLAVAAGDERLGDVAVFSRDGGGHVGLFIAETHTTYVILGGNQGNSVSFTEMAKERLLGMRRYYATGLPQSAKLVTMNSSGKISINEA